MKNENKEPVTLVELQNLLGQQLKTVMGSENFPRETQQKILDTASVVSNLAKQMINNGDIILRTEKLVSEGKLKNSAMVRLINGEVNGEAV